MQCQYCARPIPTGDGAADMRSPACSIACENAFLAVCVRGRTLIGVWNECAMWRLPNGHLHVQVDTANKLHTRILDTGAPLRPGDAASLRRWLDAMHGPDGRVHNMDAVVRLRAALNVYSTCRPSPSPCHPSTAVS